MTTTAQDDLDKANLKALKAYVAAVEEAVGKATAIGKARRAVTDGAANYADAVRAVEPAKDR